MTTTYKVERSANGVTGWTEIASGVTDTTYTDTPLSPSTQYFYRVKAVNAGGTSTASNVAFATTLATSVPTAPTIGTATPGYAQSTVTWTAPASNGGSAITGYIITPYIGSTAQSTTTVGVVLTANIPGTIGQAYTYKVAAINALGTGPQSNASNSSTPTPFTPANLTGVQFWGEASSLGLADNASVTSWTDLSGQGHHLLDPTGGAWTPINKTGVLDGLAVVRFSGAQYLQKTFTLSQPFTVMFVARVTATAGIQILCDGAVSGTNELWCHDGAWETHDGASLSISPADTNWHVFTVIFNGASSSLRVDGGAGVSGDTTSGVAPGGITFGARGGQAAPMTGDIFGGIVVSHAMTPTELNNVGPYFHSLAPTTLPAWTTVP